jgi:hypothetical protein
MPDEKILEICFCDPDQSIDPVSDEQLALDPAPNGALGDLHDLRDFGDSEELRRRLRAVSFHFGLSSNVRGRIELKTSDRAL